MHLQTPFYLLERILGLVEKLKHQRAAELPLVVVVHLKDLLERRDVDVILEVLEYGGERLVQGGRADQLVSFRDAQQPASSSGGWDTRYPLTWTC